MTRTTITLDSPQDSITFTPDGADTDIFGAAPSAGAFLYNDESLDSWYALPSLDINASKRAGGHGTYGLGKTTTGGAEPRVMGRYIGLSPADAIDALYRLSAMYNDGSPIVMRVTDDKGTTSRVVWVTDFEPDWTATDTFTWDMSLFAPDPRRYGTLIDSGLVGLPTPSSGLVWPLGTSPTGRYFDWGTPGSAGTIAMTNPGNATAFPAIIVGGGGTFTQGFRVTEVETGRRMEYPYQTQTADRITMNSRTRRATQDTSDVTELFTVREWFQVPAGSTRTYLLAPLGATTGAPTYRATMMPANL